MEISDDVSEESEEESFLHGELGEGLLGGEGNLDHVDGPNEVVSVPLEVEEESAVVDGVVNVVPLVPHLHSLVLDLVSPD